jgi:hypothetical protein
MPKTCSLIELGFGLVIVEGLEEHPARTTPKTSRAAHQGRRIEGFDRSALRDVRSTKCHSAPLRPSPLSHPDAPQPGEQGYPAGSSHPRVLRRVHVPGGSKQFGCVCSACMRERTAFESHE